MRFKLQAFVIAVSLVAMFVGLMIFVEWTWFGPARIGTAAQGRLDAAFAKNQWEGWATAWHYDYRVRITSPDIGDDEVEQLYPILHDIPWLRHIELYGTAISDEGLSDLKREFPDCHFTISD